MARPVRFPADVSPPRGTEAELYRRVRAAQLRLQSRRAVSPDARPIHRRDLLSDALRSTSEAVRVAGLQYAFEADPGIAGDANVSQLLADYFVSELRRVAWSPKLAALYPFMEYTAQAVAVKQLSDWLEERADDPTAILPLTVFTTAGLEHLVATKVRRLSLELVQWLAQDGTALRELLRRHPHIVLDPGAWEIVAGGSLAMLDAPAPADPYILPTPKVHARLRSTHWAEIGALGMPGAATRVYVDPLKETASAYQRAAATEVLGIYLAAGVPDATDEWRRVPPQHRPDTQAVRGAALRIHAALWAELRCRAPEHQSLNPRGENPTPAGKRALRILAAARATHPTYDAMMRDLVVEVVGRTSMLPELITHAAVLTPAQGEQILAIDPPRELVIELLRRHAGVLASPVVRQAAIGSRSTEVASLALAHMTSEQVVGLLSRLERRAAPAVVEILGRVDACEGLQVTPAQLAPLLTSRHDAVRLWALRTLGDPVRCTPDVAGSEEAAPEQPREGARARR